ncbi:hypothetical protein POTOM_033681 [Populus tomentosa]|uniref:Glycoside hydrolase family 3 N-terminal domain-containing protein n=1 Tax=Populus tomentosa TaxID=118781 RepID=A0A8X8CQW2_POPTO|nr:hypothetical protein POTOM_033681 [Populus tomentosa]
MRDLMSRMTLAEKIGQMTQRVAVATADVLRDYSTGSILNSRKGVPYVGGKDKVAACAKHFVGDGGTTKGINENNTVIGYHGLMSIHMPAYFHSIIKGVSTVMVSYSSWNGQKMHANRYLVKTVLKDTLKFGGFVISDWEGVDMITYPSHSNYTESVLKGISAGIDMIMVPYNHTEFINIVTD